MTSKHVAPRPIQLLAGVVLAVVAVCVPSVRASATPGSIVHTFGHLANGTVTLDVAGHDFVAKVLHQQNGKIITVGDADERMVVTRFLANGALDTTFGHGGMLTADIGTGGFVSDAVLQNDGKIVVVGFTISADPDFFVTRVTSSGTLDSSWTLPNSRTNFGPGATEDEAFGVALGPGGTVVVSGLSAGKVALARYTSTGKLDTTFSSDGKVTSAFGTQSQSDDVAVQLDGKIVVGGAEFSESGLAKPVIARFTTSGALDSTFGSSGRIPPATTPIAAVNALALQGTNVLAVGSIGSPNDLSTFGISRFTSSGAIDTTFGSGGTRRTSVAKFVHIGALTFDGSGRIVVVGLSTYNPDAFPDAPTHVTVLRYSANGALDGGFGCAGSVQTEVLGNGAGRSYTQSVGSTVVTAGNDIIVAGSATTPNGTDFPPTDQIILKYDGDPPLAPGYALVRADGGTSSFAGAPACGSTAGLPLRAPVVAMAFDPASPGYWLAASDGGVFTFGTAHFYGSMGGVRLAQPVVGMAAAPDGKGYWLVAKDGGIFAFGSARFFGSMGGVRLAQPIVGMAAAKDGKGYWLVAKDGGVFAFGSARFEGSMGGVHLSQPVVGMAADPDGRGYWLVAKDGGIFAFQAHFYGSTGGFTIAQPVVGVAADPDGTGYWLGARDGGVFAFAAPFAGSTGATPFPAGSPRSTVGIGSIGGGPI